MIDEGFQQQLLSALQVAVGNVNRGDDVNTAVSKAASAADFNKEQTQRLCETFNTARTIYHFERNPDQKTAEFKLVDKAAVLAAVFGADKSAAATPFVNPAIPDYSEYEGRELDARFGKAASAEPLWEHPADAVPDVEAQSRRLLRIVRTQEQLAKHAEADARLADEHASRQTLILADELAYDFWNTGREKYARLVRCYDGKPEYAPVLAALKGCVPDYMQLDAAVLAKAGRVVDDRDLGVECTMIEEIKDALQGAANLRALGMQVAKEASDARTQFEALVAPQPVAPASEFAEFLSENFKRAEVSTVTKGKSYTLGQLIGDEPPSEVTMTHKTPTLSDAAKGFGDAASAAGVGIDTLLGTNTADFNKKITDRLRNQQREVLMQDLFINDPFISEADPQTVAALYQQIMQVAPEVSLNKEVVRGVLRQGLHNVTAVSPFDAQAWADLEKTIREVQGTLPTRNQPKPGGGKK